MDYHLFKTGSLTDVPFNKMVSFRDSRMVSLDHFQSSSKTGSILTKFSSTSLDMEMTTWPISEEDTVTFGMKSTNIWNIEFDKFSFNSTQPCINTSNYHNAVVI